MDRRRFLSSLLGSAAVVAIGGLALRPASALAGEAAAFAKGLQAHPWLVGWRSVQAAQLGPRTVPVQGRLPAGFAGSLYRNGPAWTERAGFRYDHWFDGDGMVHRWRFNGDGTLTHQARMVATPKFTREQEAGRFLYTAAGTSVPDAQPVRNNDGANTANTSVTLIDGRLFALCESGSAFELDPDQLDTLGPVTWREDLAVMPFSAHPLRDADGSVWNFGSINLMGGNGLLIWHLGADGRLLSADIVHTPAPGYLHAFAQTPGRLVFVLMPYAFDPAAGASFFERMRFTPDQPCRIAVVEKDRPGQARWFEAPFAAIYHFGDAFERSGELWVRAIGHDNPDEARSPMQAAMHGDGAGQRGAATRLLTLRLDLAQGRARWEPTGLSGLEFPVFDPRTAAGRDALLYAPTTVGRHDAPYFNAVAVFDVERGRRVVHDYGPHVLAEEHVFVPRPGSARADEGWLVGTVLDAARDRSGIAVLDARHLDRGPLAQAWLPDAVPLGFHGCFAA
ncbi:carotenoid oxygenase family protein [Pseudoxanthomonas winnipegensis]|uniref:carotenoid oxygenase family protein n=1 Tax=Pseudoxanthomonas winnipegensis TaxID=2480810 RepID=UPI003F8469A3